MKETVLGIGITVAAYALSRRINRLCPGPLTGPVLLSTPLVMVTITLTGGGLSGYRAASEAITWWLGPAIVSLAVPFYVHRQVLLDHWARVVGAVLGGTFVAIVTSVALARLLGLDLALQGAIALKTATVAIALASRLGAEGPVVAGMVVASALIGTILGPSLLTHLGVQSSLGRGVALGAIAHGQGVAQAFREHELTGASATVAMALAAIAVSVLALPLAAWLATS